jgi:hypothetical protein
LLAFGVAVSSEPTVASPVTTGSESNNAPATTALVDAAHLEVEPTEFVVLTSAVTNLLLWDVVVTKVVRLAAPEINSQSLGFAETAAVTAVSHSYQ